MIIHGQIGDLAVSIGHHRATSARAAPAHPGAARPRATDRTVARAFRPPHGIQPGYHPACHRCAHAHHPATSATAHLTGIPYPPGLPPCTAQHLYNSRTSTAPAGVLCAAFPARSALPPCRRLTRSLRAHPGTTFGSERQGIPCCTLPGTQRRQPSAPVMCSPMVAAASWAGSPAGLDPPPGRAAALPCAGRASPASTRTRRPDQLSYVEPRTATASGPCRTTRRSAGHSRRRPLPCGRRPARRAGCAPTPHPRSRNTCGEQPGRTLASADRTDLTWRAFTSRNPR